MNFSLNIFTSLLVIYWPLLIGSKPSEYSSILCIYWLHISFDKSFVLPEFISIVIISVLYLFLKLDSEDILL